MVYAGGAGPVRDRTGTRSVVQAPAVRLPGAARRDISPAIDPRARRRSPFPELDCIRDRLSPAMIAAVEQRAISLGVGADRVLIACGVIDEEAYFITVARWLGWDYESFDRRNRYSCPLPDDRLIDAARNGLLPLNVNGALDFVVAPRSVRHLLDYVAKYPGARFRLTSSFRLDGFIADFAGEALGKHAADALLHGAPQLSSGTRHLPSRVVYWSLAALLAGAVFVFHGPTIAAIETIFTVFFLTWLGLRLWGCFLTPAAIECSPVADRDLPIYTIIAALYREANTVEKLIASLRALDYPGIR